MMKHDARFSEAVASAVTAIERTTDAELVVVAASRSGTYADVSARAAGLVALAAGVALIVSPWHVEIVWWAVDVLFVGWISERALRRPGAVKLLTREARRHAQVRAAAEREFVREAVHGTPNRSGVLIYVSALEGRVELIPDLGVDGMVPQAELAAVHEKMNASSTEGFVAGLHALGEVLAKRVPSRPDSDAFDLPNEPRVLA